jgi:uncharacterized protein YgfB (UPF0149 family)
MTHRELQAVLLRIDSAVGASEAHGWLCGALCVRASFGAAEWLAGLADDADGVAAAGELPTFTELHAEALESLRSEDFGFTLVLPEEDVPLAERVAALAEWCGGFLYGVGAAGASEAAAKSGTVAEILGDLADISRAELEPDRDGDAGEADYTELQEFVRAGAQLAWEELAGFRAGTAMPQAVH